MSTAATKKPGAKKAPPPAQPPKDALDAFVEAANKDPRRAIMMMLWRSRMQNPDMYVQVNERDLDAFAKSCAYLKAEPAIRIHREPGLPEHPGYPAQGGRRAVPARPATPAKPYAVIMLVELDKRTGEPSMNMLKPIEDNEADYNRSLDAAAVRRAADQAPDLASHLAKAAQTGDFSSSVLQDAAAALMLLGRAQQSP